VNELGVHGSPAADRIFTRLALERAAARPWQTLTLKVRNLLYFFWPRLVPAYLHTEHTSVVLGPGAEARVENSRPRHWAEHAAYTTSWVVVMATAGLGAWVRRGMLRQDVILLSMLGVFLAAGIVYFPATRYRSPVEFVLLFYAAVGLSSVPWRRRRAGID
jgi:hypothetical protein